MVFLLCHRARGRAHVTRDFSLGLQRYNLFLKWQNKKCEISLVREIVAYVSRQLGGPVRGTAVPSAGPRNDSLMTR